MLAKPSYFNVSPVCKLVENSFQLCAATPACRNQGWKASLGTKTMRVAWGFLAQVLSSYACSLCMQISTFVIWDLRNRLATDTPAYSNTQLNRCAVATFEHIVPQCPTSCLDSNSLKTKT